MLVNLHGNKVITTLTVVSLFIALITAIITMNTIFNTTHIPKIAFSFILIWLVAAIIFSLLSFKEFVSGYLLCAFSMMIAWRIGGLYNVQAITYPLIFTFILLLLNFLYCVWMNLHHPQKYIHKISLEGWQLIFIRLYLGFDFIPHFTEKLFAGRFPRSEDINAFIYLGVPHAEFFVWLAGFCEFGAAIALSLGFMMRLGAIGAALYLCIATYLGHHFFLGFIWAGPGGGWEFATMWIVLVLAYAITGAHQFSIDQRLEDRFKLPKFLKLLM
jgi:putative oxidoreductase